MWDLQNIQRLQFPYGFWSSLFSQLLLISKFFKLSSSTIGDVDFPMFLWEPNPGIVITTAELEVTDLTHIFETGTWWEPSENQDGIFSTSQDAPKPFHLLCKKSPYCLSNYQVAEIHWADSFDRLPPRWPTTRALMQGQLEASLKEGYGNAEMYEHTCMYVTVYLSIHTHTSHCRTSHPGNAPRVPLVLVVVVVVVIVVVVLLLLVLVLVVVVAAQNTLPGLKDLKHGDDWNPTHCKVSFEVWRYSEVIQPANMVMPWASTWGSVRSSILSGQSTRIALIELRAILHTTIHFWSPLGVPGHGSS